MGAIIAGGWIATGYDITCPPFGVPQKFAASVLFIILGVVIAFENGRPWERLRFILLMSAIAVAVYPLTVDPEDMKRVEINGMPSIATLFLFGAIATATPRLPDTPYFVCAVSLCAVIGHFVRVPVMYFRFPESSGMAFTAAVAFLAVGVLLLKKQYERRSDAIY